MYESILKEVGLNLNDSRVYEALLSMENASIEQIALKSKVHRRNVYDVLQNLLDKGLISESFTQNKKEYKATNPSRLVDLLNEKERRVRAILPNLEKQFSQYEENEAAYLYKGINGVKQYLRDILDAGETAYFIGAKALWLDPRLKYFLIKFDQERKKKGIKFMHLFDHDVKEQRPDILKFVGKPYKFLPKSYSSPTCIDIFGDRVVTFIGIKPGQLADEPVQFVLKSRQLAEGYKKFFWFMWDHLP